MVGCKMKTIILLIALFSVAEGQAQAIRDEVISQKYENLILDGETKDEILDQMTTEGVTPEDLELTEEMEEG